MISKVYFVTGISGSGKTTLVELLKQKLKSACVYDFDEKGVPKNPDINWRIETTDMWLKKAKENLAKGKLTVICGVCVPKEVKASNYCTGLNPQFAFLYIPDDVIKQRLKERKWSETEIQNNINWADKLLKFVHQQPKSFIIDSSVNKPEAVAEKIMLWIEND